MQPFTKAATRSPSSSPCGPSFQFVRVAFDLIALALAWRITAELRIFLNPYMAVAFPQPHA